MTDIIPTGSVIWFPGKKLPDGWLLCDGQSIDIIATEKYNNLLQNLYCGDSHNNDAAFGFRSDKPTQEQDLTITINRLVSETPSSNNLKNNGVVSVSIAGGSKDYTFTIDGVSIRGSENASLTISNLDSDLQHRGVIKDMFTDITITFDIVIGYTLLANSSYIVYNEQRYNDSNNNILRYTARNPRGRYLYLPNFIDEKYYCIKY